MMIRNQNLDAQFPGCGNSVQTGNTIIHRDQQRRLFGGSNPDDFRRQTVTELKPVRHDKIHLLCTQALQPPDSNRAAGCAVGVEVCDNHNFVLLCQCLLQQIQCGFHTFEQIRSGQAGQRFIKLIRVADIAMGVDSPQQWRDR